jgi:TolB-like protein/Flp pilus assembly protein TadD
VRNTLPMSEFLQRLKQRKLVQWTLAYVAAAFALLQGIDIVAQRFGWPEQTMRFVIIALSVGLFVTLVLAWYHGERGAQRVTGTELLILALLLAIGGGLLWRFVNIARGPTEQSGAARASAESKSEINAKSVAVLAFANLSDDKGSEYFSDGISEELLTVLQKIPGLRVAARTSAFSFKGKNATAQEIGQKLGVAHLVEGSVRKAGETVRIAARLTKTTSGDEIWSENYTRNLKDVFAVQTELAQTIVEQLRGQLTGGGDAKAKAVIQEQVQMAEKGGTKNVEAHQSYLQGRFYGDRNSEKSAAEALVAYQRAVELDPNFALAWAGLAETHVWECFYSGELSRTTFDKHLADGRDAVARALSLEPNLPEALSVRAKMQLGFDFDWKGAAETLRTALALAPTNVGLLISAGNLALAQGDPERATTFYHQAVTLDPVNPAARSNLAQNLVVTRHFAEAEAEYPRVVELNPAAPYAHAGLGLSYLLQGKFEDAVTEAQKDAAEWARLSVVAPALWSQKHIRESDAALDRLKAVSADTAAYQIAEVHAYRGEKDEAFEWLERARRQLDPGLAATRSDPLFVNLHGDSRWEPFLHKMGMADDQLK